MINIFLNFAITRNFSRLLFNVGVNVCFVFILFLILPNSAFANKNETKKEMVIDTFEKVYEHLTQQTNNDSIEFIMLSWTGYSKQVIKGGCEYQMWGETESSIGVIFNYKLTIKTSNLDRITSANYELLGLSKTQQIKLDSELYGIYKESENDASLLLRKIVEKINADARLKK